MLTNRCIEDGKITAMGNCRRSIDHFEADGSSKRIEILPDGLSSGHTKDLLTRHGHDNRMPWIPMPLCYGCCPETDRGLLDGNTRGPLDRTRE